MMDFSQSTGIETRRTNSRNSILTFRRFVGDIRRPPTRSTRITKSGNSKRKSVRNLMQGYERLRAHVPSYSIADVHMTKKETLIAALTYIQDLTHVLENGDDYGVNRACAKAEVQGQLQKESDLEGRFQENLKLLDGALHNRTAPSCRSRFPIDSTTLTSESIRNEVSSCPRSSVGSTTEAVPKTSPSSTRASDCCSTSSSFAFENTSFSTSMLYGEIGTDPTLPSEFLGGHLQHQRPVAPITAQVSFFFNTIFFIELRLRGDQL